jgi:hypothetical protein
LGCFFNEATRALAQKFQNSYNILMLVVIVGQKTVHGSCYTLLKKQRVKYLTPNFPYFYQNQTIGHKKAPFKGKNRPSVAAFVPSVTTFDINTHSHKEKNMTHYTDWLPTTRTGQLAMAKDWQNVMETNAVAWGYPYNYLDRTRRPYTDGGNTFETAQNETIRTPVVTIQCKVAFEALTAKMQDIKKLTSHGCQLHRLRPQASRQHPHIKRNARSADNGGDFLCRAAGKRHDLPYNIENKGKKGPGGPTVSVLIP